MAERIGPHLLELALPTSPGWHRCGFAVAAGRIHLTNTAVRVDGSLTELGLDRSVADEAPTWLGLPLNVIASPEVSMPPPHANHVVSLDHVVVMTPDTTETVASIAAMGWEIRRERPSVIAGVDVIQRFVWAGEVLLEIVTPLHPTSLIDTAKVWGVSFSSSDLDATVEFLGDSIGSPRDAVQPGRRIATVRRKLLELPVEVAVMSAID